MNLDVRETRTLAAGDSFRLLAEAGIPVAACASVQTLREVRDALRSVPGPWAVKLDSPLIPHKTEYGAVTLGLETEADVSHAAERMFALLASVGGAGAVLIQHMAPVGLECLVGMQRDPDFGPIVVFGIGGTLVELLDDVAIGIVPFEAAHARRMVQSLRAAPLFEAWRGRPPMDVDAVVDVLLAVGNLALREDVAIASLDVNPLMAYPDGEGVCAVDVVVTVPDGPY
jgi:acyl-CoA synthetase (NDP forming)